MPLCAFSANFAMYDVTPVENLFILEYMPFAPGDYVRVYLYGLMQCYHPSGDSSIEEIARVLVLKPEKVLEAFKYWEQKGAVVGMSDNPPSYQYISLKTATSGRDQEEEAYQYKHFNSELQSIFGSDKLLHPQEYQKAMEWVEDLNLPREVVLALARSKVESLRLRGRSVRYAFRDIEKDALKFAEMGIRTEEAAAQYLLRDTRKYALAEQVLKQYNLRRSPTMAEVDIADKWLNDWNFDEADVLRAQSETVRSTNPSFAYLDGILANHRTAAGGLSAKLDADGRLFDETKGLLQALGSGVMTPSPEQISTYEKLLTAGMSREVLMKAAAQCCMQNRHSFEALERMVKKWMSLGLTSLEAVAEYAQRREDAYLVLEKCGISRKPTEADVDQLIAWRKKQPTDVIEYAAECAHGTQLPLKYLDKLLSEWASTGITTLEAAQKARASHGSVKQPGGSKRVLNGQQYEQRTYDNDKLSYLAVDLEKLAGGDDNEPQ